MNKILTTVLFASFGLNLFFGYMLVNLSHDVKNLKLSQIKQEQLEKNIQEKVEKSVEKALRPKSHLLSQLNQ